MTYVFPIAVSRLAELLRAPVQNVATHWPDISSALDAQNIFSERVALVALATIHVETPSFMPIHEYGDEAYFRRMYDPLGEHPQLAARLGNLNPGDGVRYAGRGFIQLTGRKNYRQYGTALELPLEDNPDLAMQSAPASAIFALFFAQRKVDAAAEVQNWRECRRLVNGGFNGLDVFLSCISLLQGELSGASQAAPDV